jgi:hypothetical protein
MLSRGSFVGASSLLPISIVPRSASTQENTSPLLNLDFLDRSAARGHAQALAAAPRHVAHELFGDLAGIMMEDAALNRRRGCRLFRLGNLSRRLAFESKQPFAVTTGGLLTGSVAIRLAGAGLSPLPSPHLE